MKGIIVTLFDSKAETYSPPTVAESNAAAIRQLGILVNDRQQTLVATHPEDFTLFRIASFDGCEITPEPSRVALANGIDVKTVAPSQE